MGVSFEMPEYTTDVNSLGTLRILDAIKNLGLEKKQNFTKHQLLNYLVKFNKKNSLRIQNFTQKAPMLVQSYLLIGLPRTTEIL